MEEGKDLEPRVTQWGPGNDRSDKIIAILGWIIALMLVLYAGIYFGQLEKKAARNRGGSAAPQAQAGTAAPIAAPTNFLVIVTDFSDESQALDFIARNLGFKYISPRSKAGNASIHEVKIGVFRNHGEALEVAQGYRDKGFSVYIEPIARTAEEQVAVPAVPAAQTPVTSVSNRPSPAVTERPSTRVETPAPAPVRQTVEAPAAQTSPAPVSRPAPTRVVVETPAVKPLPAEEKTVVQPTPAVSLPAQTRVSTPAAKAPVTPVAPAAPKIQPAQEKTVASSSAKITDQARLASMYTVQVFSLSSRERALEQVSRFEKDGYHVYLTSTAGSPTFYRVRVGAYESRDQALKEAEHIRSEYSDVAAALVIEGVLKK